MVTHESCREMSVDTLHFNLVSCQGLLYPFPGQLTLCLAFQMDPRVEPAPGARCSPCGGRYTQSFLSVTRVPLCPSAGYASWSRLCVETVPKMGFVLGALPVCSHCLRMVFWVVFRLLGAHYTHAFGSAWLVSVIDTSHSKGMRDGAADRQEAPQGVSFSV